MRVIGLLEALAFAEDGLALVELAQRLDCPKSSLLLLLRPLVTSGHLVHTAGRYRLGSAAYRLATSILAARRYPAELRAALEWLAEQSDETVFLTAIDREAGLVSYIEMIESPQAVRYVPGAGSTRPLYTSAAGRMLLAHQDSAWVEAYFRRTELRKITSRSITSLSRLRDIIAQTRAAGVSITDGETVEGAAGCAAPVFNGDASVDLAILIGAPADRFKRNTPRMVALVKEAAARASSSAAPAAYPAVAVSPTIPAAALRAGSQAGSSGSASRGTQLSPRAPRAR
jgi:DNA-binding IclR family transcriptional regulator